MRYSTFALWRAAADAALLQCWGINYADAGASDADLQTWFADHQRTGETPLEAARAYGEAYDLIEPDPYTAADLQRRHPIPKGDQCATPEQVARATAPVQFTGDPNYGGALEPGEAFAAGNYGTVCFDAATGKVTRHFPGADFDGDDMADLPQGAWQPGYLDIASFDVASVEGGVKPGDLFDIIRIGFTTAEGEYVAAEPWEEDEAAA